MIVVNIYIYFILLLKISRQEWSVAPSIFNIKARTRIGSLPSLGEIELRLRQSVQGVCSWQYGSFNGRACEK